MLIMLNYVIVDGAWGNWADWSGCSKSCNGGIRQRIRACNDPIHKCGGKHCSGNPMDEETCNDMSCPGKKSVVKMK